jgi:hypothetical protein
LYIVDREGNIRFHRSGYERDHFAERLGWMIDAAR